MGPAAVKSCAHGELLFRLDDGQAAWGLRLDDHSASGAPLVVRSPFDFDPKTNERTKEKSPTVSCFRLKDSERKNQRGEREKVQKEKKETLTNEALGRHDGRVQRHVFRVGAVSVIGNPQIAAHDEEALGELRAPFQYVVVRLVLDHVKIALGAELLVVVAKGLVPPSGVVLHHQGKGLPIPAKQKGIIETKSVPANGDRKRPKGGRLPR